MRPDRKRGLHIDIVCPRHRRNGNPHRRPIHDWHFRRNARETHGKAEMQKTCAAHRNRPQPNLPPQGHGDRPRMETERSTVTNRTGTAIASN